MLRNSLTLLAIISAVAMIANASTLDITASGVFSTSDTPNAPYIAPGDPFTISFDVTSAPTPSTSLLDSVYVPISNFSYDLNGNPVSLTSSETPTEVQFYDNSLGGGFELVLASDPSSFTAPSFVFSGASLFSNGTSNPMFSAGTFAVTSWSYFDSSNANLSEPLPVSVSAQAVPEPSAFVPLLGGLLALAVVSSRKFRAARWL